MKLTQVLFLVFAVFTSEAKQHLINIKSNRCGAAREKNMLRYVNCLFVGDEPLQPKPNGRVRISDDRLKTVLEKIKK
jgi:hypothetical protein